MLSRTHLKPLHFHLVILTIYHLFLCFLPCNPLRFISLIAHHFPPSCLSKTHCLLQSGIRLVLLPSMTLIPNLTFLFFVGTFLLRVTSMLLNINLRTFSFNFSVIYYVGSLELLYWVLVPRIFNSSYYIIGDFTISFLFHISK